MEELVAKYGLTGALLVTVIWFLRGPASTGLRLIVDSTIAAHAKMIATMETVERNAGVSAAAAAANAATVASTLMRLDERLADHAKRDEALQQSILSEIRCGADERGPGSTPIAAR